jgi:glycosyltransferase involved in cell wall biosynthesis
MIKIAVLITCHNRIQKTQTCLKSLFKQKKIENINLKVFLVDDGSTDGTKEYKKRIFKR